MFVQYSSPETRDFCTTSATRPGVHGALRFASLTEVTGHVSCFRWNQQVFACCLSVFVYYLTNCAKMIKCYFYKWKFAAGENVESFLQRVTLLINYGKYLT